jgi:MFS superfamily sulfate permease-like transporter
MTSPKSGFRFYRQDLFASLSLFLVSLPITIGISIASKAPPEAGMISSIFGALFFGLFSSSHLALYGPAAGLCVFISATASQYGSFEQVSAATILAGLLLLGLSRINAFKIIHLFPMSVVKGMASGIGITLVLKMVPHMIGFEDELLEAEGLLGFDDFTALEPTEQSESRFSSTAVAISVVSVFVAWKFRAAARLPYAFFVVLVGALMAWGAQVFFPEQALTHAQMLHMNMSQFTPHFLDLGKVQFWPALRLALLITTVILLEGMINLNLVQKLDPERKPIQFKRELKLLGFGNIGLGFIGALPVMPILVRSTANIEFGAKSRFSAILQGVWLSIALVFAHVYDFIPMAAVASLLALVGLNLVRLDEIKTILRRGKAQYVPFLLTLLVVLAVDLLWGVVAGLVIGIFFSIRSTLHRTMVLVHDQGDYLLKFFKDVTFIHKYELKDQLDQVPEGHRVLIDGTGNIAVDSDIEDWLLEYQRDSKLQGRHVEFIKSQLAISKLFKENSHG